MEPVKIIIVGAGSRGSLFGDYYAEHPQEAKIVGVAEPCDFRRNRMAEKHNISSENIFKDWKEVADREKFADAVIITTQDQMHTQPAVSFAKKGYHLLLEKPMAVTEESCKQIVEVVLESKIVFAVCHCLRYARDTQTVKDIIDSGAIGRVINVQRLEPVGYWHQAHSFVRGSWGNSKISSPMLLQKSCHDLDWIRYIMGERCVQISSFGNLTHFKKENMPIGACDRCMDCGIEAQCPYSAKKLYLKRVEKNDFGWPVDVITSDFTLQGVTEALQTGPYGRCVYRCDNDVVDHQVVNMLFEGGLTASLTMTAFCKFEGRKTSIFGTKGQLYIDDSKIEHFDFLTEQTKIIDTVSTDNSLTGGHGGGDYVLAKVFAEAIAGKRGGILSGPEETLETHLMAFAAEKSRHLGSVVTLEDKDYNHRQKMANGMPRPEIKITDFSLSNRKIDVTGPCKNRIHSTK